MSVLHGNPTLRTASCDGGPPGAAAAALSAALSMGPGEPRGEDMPRDAEAGRLPGLPVYEGADAPGWPDSSLLSCVMQQHGQTVAGKGVVSQLWVSRKQHRCLSEAVQHYTR